MGKIQHYDVIIIGAGISGLAAANFLRKRRKKLLVLEARNYIGGRISTHRQFDVPIDLGASILHDVLHNSLVDTTQFPIEQFPVSSISTQPQNHAVYNSIYKRIPSFKVKKISEYVEEFLLLLKKQSDSCRGDRLLESFKNQSLVYKDASEIKKWL